MRTVDRIIATSDIHGQNTKLLKLLNTALYEPDQDLLVICGDLIDRGVENLDTLATCADLQKKGAILLKGNHEQFLEQSLKEMLISDIWRSHPSESLNNWVQHNGGAEMFHEIKDLSNNKLAEILNFVQSLPIYFEVGNYIFTHAGANARKPIQKNTEDETVWMKDNFPYCPAYKNKIIIFGHVPTWKDKIGIDCGGVFGGRLAAIELPSYREFY